MQITWISGNARVEILIPTENFLAHSDRAVPFFEKPDEIYFTPTEWIEVEWLLNYFNKLYNDKQPIPRWLQSYFAGFSGRVLNGWDPKSAMILSPEKHRARSLKTYYRNEGIYYEVTELLDSGKTLLESALELSEKYNLHESNIQKIYSTIKAFRTTSDNEDPPPF